MGKKETSFLPIDGSPEVEPHLLDMYGKYFQYVLDSNTPLNFIEVLGIYSV